MLNEALVEIFRCPEGFAKFDFTGLLSLDSGYFRFSPNTICYGRSCAGPRAKLASDGLYDTFPDVEVQGRQLRVPFDPGEVVNNLRHEHYMSNSAGMVKSLPKDLVRSVYSGMRPFLPVSVRRHLQRIYVKDWKQIVFPCWPVDHTVEDISEKFLILSLQARGASRVPFIWFWPDGFPSALLMTHDIETEAGRDFCKPLIEINNTFGIRASFQIVPEERYKVSSDFLDRIRSAGSEVNVHDLNHDGYLFADKEEFLRRARRINFHAREYGAGGFRAGAMYRKVEWYDAFEFSYDMTVPNVAHLDPQRGGCCTVMPYFIGKILELPLTTTQDYALFHMLGEYSINLWKWQIDLIRGKNGLISFIIHPDYIIEDQARGVYTHLLEHISRLRAEGQVWVALPGEIDAWWRARSQMRVVRRGTEWQIEGPCKDRARLAYASGEGERIVYTLPGSLLEPGLGAASLRDGI